MDAERASQELKVIRQLMERPVRYSTQSGLSGIVAGLAALGGVAADWSISRRLQPRAAFWVNLAVWAGVFVVAFTTVTVLTRLRERRRGMPFWSPVKMRILRTILPPFAAGVGLTLIIAFRWYFGAPPNEWGLIPSIWMLFYGVALWQLGEFSVREIRVLGVAFLAAGLAAAIVQHAIPGMAEGSAVYLAVGVTFGGFHLCYGAIVWMRYGG